LSSNASADSDLKQKSKTFHLKEKTDPKILVTLDSIFFHQQLRFLNENGNLDAGVKLSPGLPDFS
jgi:hypothetical protein